LQAPDEMTLTITVRMYRVSQKVTSGAASESAFDWQKNERRKALEIISFVP